MIYQGVHYQSRKYCRTTRRNNYTVEYNGNAGFIEYFLGIEKDGNWIYYAVIRQLVDLGCVEALSKSLKVKLPHIKKYSKNL